jgi:1-deoxy-D-xylulose-5-phosphate reductoisomerase
MRTITIIGSTGSIGRTALEVIAQHNDKFKIKALVANTNWELLAQQAIAFKAEHVIILDETHYNSLKDRLQNTSVKIHAGMKQLLDFLQEGQDVVLSALIGIVGLMPTYNSIGNCKILALANKEALICAGSLLKQKASSSNTIIVPVDSEHSAIFQALDTNHRKYLKNVSITASGGPFREFTLEEMKNVTLEQALKHPNWQMGPKITIDSATLFNKGLEFIEAMYLFDLSPSEIEIIIHPQSIIHGMITYIDGSTIAQMGYPSMTVPIAYSINYPDRMELEHRHLDLATAKELTFFKPDLKRFPMLGIALEVAKLGQGSQIIANCANELAVNAFLNNKIGFLDIERLLSKALNSIQHFNINSIEDALATQRIVEDWFETKY